ncbi:MAG TPA: HNH endonuclease [Bryobacteraceae bacterium]|jgi:hypothetical protein
MNATGEQRAFLVLWKWKEALEVRGTVVTEGFGKHSGGLKKGDRVFIWATTKGELYLLGSIVVRRSGVDWMEGRSLYGPFRIIPLKNLKWQIRFGQTEADRLSRHVHLALQVRSRRRCTTETIELLDAVLRKAAGVDLANFRAREGRIKQVILSKRERNRNLRAIALSMRGSQCEICGFDFAETYGEFAKNCVEVHHLQPLASAPDHGLHNEVEDLLVVCPNCHRALHQFRDPSNWRAFRRSCDLP